MREVEICRLSHFILMNYDLLIAGAALFVTIIVNIVLIAFFSGTLKANQTHQKEMLEFLRLEFKEHFDRLEAKQDKHNNLIERMVVVATPPISFGMAPEETELLS